LVRNHILLCTDIAKVPVLENLFREIAEESNRDYQRPADIESKGDGLIFPYSNDISRGPSLGLMKFG
jgi:hypothetical protein